MMLSRRKPSPAQQRQPEPAPEHPALEIERDLTQARDLLATAEKALADARLAYTAALDAGGVAAAMAANEAVSKYIVERDVAARLVERLEAQHAEALEGARTAAEAAARDRAAREAAETAEAYRLAYAELMPQLHATARRLLRLWAEAAAAQDAAQRHGIKAPNPDAFRSVPYRPQQILAHRTVDAWINPWSGHPLSEDQMKDVRLQADGSGYYSYTKTYANGEEQHHVRHLTSRQRVEFFDYIDSAPPRQASPLPALIDLPEVHVDGRPGWKAMASPYGVTVLKALDILEAPPPAPAKPQVRTDYRALEPARTVADDRSLFQRARDRLTGT